MTDLLTLKEYGKTEGVRLSTSERDALLQIAPSITVSPTANQVGHYDLTPSSFIGTVLIEDRSIIILPKIPVHRVVFLLSYSMFGSNCNEYPFLADPEQDVVEAITSAFLNHAQRAFNWGLLRGYQTQEEETVTVRGRIRFDDQIRFRYGRTPPVSVRFDEFTVDVEENRIVKAAMWRLLQLHPRDNEHRKLLLAMRSSLQGVQLTNYDPQRLPEFAFNRLNVHYEPLIAIAKQILKSSSFEIKHGTLPARAMLFDMNVVFENFIYEALKNALELSDHSFPQGIAHRRLNLDFDSRIKLKPDISWWDRGECKFVGDIKYKNDHRGDGTNPDLYQLLAYVIATDLRSGTLIYAQGEAETRTHDINHVERELDVLSVDLDCSPESVLAQIGNIANRIKMRAKSSVQTTK